MPQTLPLFLAILLAAADGQGTCMGAADATCRATSTPASAGSLFIQHVVQRSQSMLELGNAAMNASSCASYQEWPDVVNGVTCGQCTALVRTAGYTGRCDAYCASFGHVCVAAAEEKDNDCQVREQKRCDEDIGGTSDMLCSCQSADTQGTGFAGGLCGNAGLYSASGSKFFGVEIRSDGGVKICEDCVVRCYLQMSDCVGAHFQLYYPGSSRGICTYFSRIDGLTAAQGYTALTKTEHLQLPVPSPSQPPSPPSGLTPVPSPSQPPSPPSGPTPVPSPPQTSTCYGELQALAQDEGAQIGSQILTSSSPECKNRCSQSAECKSITFCGGWQGCWLKTKSFNGAEATRSKADCRTYYKRSCDGTTLPPIPTGAGMIKVVSYNLYWWNAFGQNPWKGSKITDNIRNNLRPDVLGLQECDSPGTIQSRTGYERASKFSGAQGVMVKPDIFTVGDSGSQDIGATGKWGPRFVTWARLTHKASGRSFWHFNTHWCVHSGNGRTCSASKRYTGAKNMLEIIREKAANEPVIITGDFNAGLDEEGPQHFLRNGFSLAVNEWVDAIFYSTAHWKKVSSEIGDAAHSDHRPVIAELEFK
eukprot:TRINITY_DN103750_c0_g1_i1.p1 TRINITY_DN103750_c0_g1~~TRINITY_DN103750_c0_g1_i1.p1  ORF type:complete len:591 (+),score=76.80 TRINITY_DN103750_c0_g1_i1:73-1845(+)